MSLAFEIFQRADDTNIYTKREIEDQPDHDNWSKGARNFGCSKRLDQKQQHEDGAGNTNNCATIDVFFYNRKTGSGQRTLSIFGKKTEGNSYPCMAPRTDWAGVNTPSTASFSHRDHFP